MTAECGRRSQPYQIDNTQLGGPAALTITAPWPRMYRMKSALILRLCLALIATLIAFTSVANAQQYLFNRADFQTGLSPRQVVLADFNGDGRPDAAVTDEQDNDVAVRLGN